MAAAGVESSAALRHAIRGGRILGGSRAGPLGKIDPTLLGDT
jgi:hypothetical protein